MSKVTRFWIALAFLGCAAAPLRAAPRDDLLKLVPEDVGFCLVIEDLDKNAELLANSPVMEQFWTSPLGQAAATDPDWEKIVRFLKHFRKRRPVAGNQRRPAFFGQIFVYAYRPGPPGKEDGDQGLSLIRHENPQHVARFVDFMNKLIARGGNKAPQLLEHQGTKYYRGVDPFGAVHFHYAHDAVLATSSTEEVIRRVIELDRRQVSGEPPISRHLKRLGAANEFAHLWINPRAFDAALEHKIKTSQGTEAAVFRRFQGYWNALDGAGLHGSFDRDTLRVDLTLAAKVERLPMPARKLLNPGLKPSDLWVSVPDNAMLALAGRVDANALLEMLGQFLPPPAQKKLADGLQRALGAALGKDVVKDVLPLLGPDWRLCIVPPPTGDKNWFPHMTFALRIQPGKQEKPFDQAFFDLMKSYATLAVIAYNSNHEDQLTLKTATQENVEVKYLTNEGRFPPGCEPALALKGGYLVLASSLDAVRSFQAGQPAPSAGEIPILRLSLKELRAFLQAHQKALADFVASGNQQEETARPLRNLLKTAELVDRIELSWQPHADRITLSCRVRTAKPLKP